MANPFSQARDLYKMQAGARKMQNDMKKIIVSGFSKDEKVEVRINGVNELEKINIDDSMLSKPFKVRIEKNIKEAFKDANKKLQKEMMKDMDFDKLKSMIGA